MNIRDISSYDSNINFSAYDGFIIRGLRSNGLLDTNIDSYVNECIVLNKPFSFYHYINFYSDMQTQLNKINTLIAKYPCTFRSAIDLESDIYDNKIIPANINDIVHKFLDGVPNSFLYCNQNMYQTYLDNSFDKTDLWLAQYDKEVTKQYLHINVFGRQYQESPDESNFDDRLIDVSKIVPIIQPIVTPIVNIVKPVVPQPVVVPQWNAEVYQSNVMPHEYNSTAGTPFAVVGSNGVPVGSHKVDSGDRICIVNCLYDQQLLEIYYPISGGFAHGFIKNDETNLSNRWYKAWVNGKTKEVVRDTTGKESGTIFPVEKATFLFKDNHGYFILFDTTKGGETKSGYVVYAGKLGF
jgi:lysozyme